MIEVSIKNLIKQFPLCNCCNVGALGRAGGGNEISDTGLCSSVINFNLILLSASGKFMNSILTTDMEIYTEIYKAPSDSVVLYAIR